MGKVVRKPPRLDIYLYKRRDTRRYINLDQAGHAYRSAAPPIDSKRDGSYRAHSNLRDALDPLDLWELPWMKPELANHRRGLSWEDRWQLHPDFTDDLEGGDHGGDLHLV